jgi:hypothetical protein
MNAESVSGVNQGPHHGTARQRKDKGENGSGRGDPSRFVFVGGPLTGEVRPSGFFRAARRTNHQLTGEETHTQLEKWETTRQDSR